jgi:hypothetical protein
MKMITSCSLRAYSHMKGIYMAIFLMFFTVSVLAQVEKRDTSVTSTAFNRWEVGFDLKPLFNKDEPYSVLAKFHLSRRWAIRLGLGSSLFSSTFDSTYLDNSVESTDQNTFQGAYNQQTAPRDIKENWKSNIGFQYQFKIGKISCYTATNVSIERTIQRYNSFFFKSLASPYLIDSLNPNLFRNKINIDALQIDNKTLGVFQVLGFQYHFNNYLSLSNEIEIGYSRINRKFLLQERLPPQSAQGFWALSSFINSGYSSVFFFKPFASLYLNYHF